MSLYHLSGRVTRMENQRACVESPAQPVIVWMADGDTRATALQKAGLTPAEVAGKVVIFVQYEETRPDAFTI